MNNSVLKKFFILILLICSHLLPSYLFGFNLGWQELSAPPFIIYYQNSTKKNIRNTQKILNSLLSYYPKLTEDIGATSDNSIVVYISPTEEIYRQFVGENFPDWSDGVASPSRNIIILKSSNILPEHADNSKIAVHELAHILLNQAVNGNPIPRWFNEGLAVYYSGEKAFASGSLISKALVTKSIIDLTDIDDVLTFYSNKAQLAYQESYLAVSYLFEQYGKEKVKEIISELGKGLPLDQALLNIIGMEMLDFEYEWHQHIKKKYRWRFLVDFDTYLWILILALFILGFILMRLKNKRTIKRWDEEDNGWNNEWTASQSPWDPDDTD